MLKTTPLISIDDLYLTFNLNKGGLLSPRQPPVHAINGVSLDIQSGEIFCVVGESGCGKSTVARTVIGLLEPTKGTVKFDGERIDHLVGKERLPYRRHMQMIFQNPYASLNPRMTVQNILEEPLRFHFPEMTNGQVKSKVHDVMTSVGNDPSWGNRYPHEFSGGQRQRISIARALMVDPNFVIADEPISALDVSIQAQVLNVMMDARKDRPDLTYLFITHDLSVVEHIGTRVAVMYLGTVCELAETATLFAKPRHPYTQLLLSAIPKLRNEEFTRPDMKGEVPTAMDLPTGCVFHGRCPHADERCKNEIPKLTKLEGGTSVACHGVQEGRI